MYCCNSQDLDDSAVGDQLLKSSEEQDPVTGVVSYTVQQIIWQLLVTKITIIPMVHINLSAMKIFFRDVSESFLKCTLC